MAGEPHHDCPQNMFWAVAIAVIVSAVLAFSANTQQETADKEKRSMEFACAINCMDGRVQNAVKGYMQKNYGVIYVDMITEAGPNKILADNSNQAIVENIKNRAEISVRHHGARIVAIVGHFGCAGNSAEKEQQIQHLRTAKKTVESFGLGAEIVLLWVEGDWTTVQKISE